MISKIVNALYIVKVILKTTNELGINAFHYVFDTTVIHSSVLHQKTFYALIENRIAVIISVVIISIFGPYQLSYSA